MTRSEVFWYRFWCVVSLGFPYFLKLVIKKAIIEAQHPSLEETLTQAERRTYLRTGELPDEESR